MCVKDPGTGKWISCRPTGARPKGAAARDAMVKAAIARSEASAEHEQAVASGASPAAQQKAAERLESAKRAQTVAVFNYQTSDEGRAELQAEVEAARERSVQRKEELLGDGPESSMNPGFRKWLDGDERKRASAMGDRLRAVDRVRTEQDIAAKRRSEVKAGNVGEQTRKALDEAQIQPPSQHRVQGANNTIHTYTQIGVVAVDEPFTATQQYETAAWSRTHEVQPGIYPVNLSRDGNVHVRYDTKITGEHFPSLYGGVAVGKTPEPRDIGKADKHHVQNYAFSMPGSYTPGLKALGGSLVLHRGVVMEREVTPSGRGEGEVSCPTRFRFKEEPTPPPST